MNNHVEHVEHVEELKALASDVGQIAYGVHEYFGTGLLEKVGDCSSRSGTLHTDN